MPNQGTQRGTSIDLQNCVLFLKTQLLNGAGSAWTALKFGEGSLNHNIDKSYDYKGNRGRLDDLRRGPEQVLKVSFEGKFTSILSNAVEAGSGELETYSLHEILEGVEYGIEDHGSPKFAGTRESWLTAYGCPPYCCDIEIHNNPAMDCPDTLAIGEAQLIRYFRPTSISSNFQNGMVNVSGEAHVLRPMVMRCAGPEGTSPGTMPKFTYSREQDAAPFDNVPEGPWPLDPRDPNAT